MVSSMYHYTLFNKLFQLALMHCNAILLFTGQTLPGLDILLQGILVYILLVVFSILPYTHIVVFLIPAYTQSTSRHIRTLEALIFNLFTQQPNQFISTTTNSQNQFINNINLSISNLNQSTNFQNKSTNPKNQCINHENQSTNKINNSITLSTRN